jgi:hypothetical protein
MRFGICDELAFAGVYPIRMDVVPLSQCLKGFSLLQGFQTDLRIESCGTSPTCRLALFFAFEDEYISILPPLSEK